MAFSLPPTTGFNFEASLSPSESINAAQYFSTANATESSLWEKAGALDQNINDLYTSDLDLGSLIGLDSSQFLGGLAGPEGWKFITAPEDISWDIANQANRIDMFGTNNPPVVAGSRGMRDLTLSNSLVEGFIRGVNVEGKVAALENLMRYDLNSSDGFVSVPVYQVWANEKSYGGPEAYYIIKDVRVKETMRDLTGNATRAYVDISLMQVPAYQVNSGRDQASATTSGAKSGLLSQAQVNAAQQATAAGTQTAGTKSQAAATNAANQGVGTSKPAAGANSAQSTVTGTGQKLLPTQLPTIQSLPPRP